MKPSLEGCFEFGDRHEFYILRYCPVDTSYFILPSKGSRFFFSQNREVSTSMTFPTHKNAGEEILVVAAMHKASETTVESNSFQLFQLEGSSLRLVGVLAADGLEGGALCMSLSLPQVITKVRPTFQPIKLRFETLERKSCRRDENLKPSVYETLRKLTNAHSFGMMYLHVDFL